jgi:hypothetical protein
VVPLGYLQVSPNIPADDHKRLTWTVAMVQPWSVSLQPSPHAAPTVSVEASSRSTQTHAIWVYSKTVRDP